MARELRTVDQGNAMNQNEHLSRGSIPDGPECAIGIQAGPTARSGHPFRLQF